MRSLVAAALLLSLATCATAQIQLQSFVTVVSVAREFAATDCMAVESLVIGILNRASVIGATNCLVQSNVNRKCASRFSEEKEHMMGGVVFYSTLLHIVLVWECI